MVNNRPKKFGKSTLFFQEKISLHAAFLCKAEAYYWKVWFLKSSAGVITIERFDLSKILTTNDSAKEVARSKRVLCN